MNGTTNKNYGIITNKLKYMKLELDLLEWNNLYVATSRYVTQCEDELKAYGGNVSSITYFKNEVKKAEALREKIHIALHTEAIRLDEARDYVLNKQRDYAAFEHYADSMNEARHEDRMAGNI